jgi:hypothetical protein
MNVLVTTAGEFAPAMLAGIYGPEYSFLCSTAIQQI